MIPEDQEFEAAKGFVRFAGEAVKNAAGAPASTPPQAAAQAAAVQAARRYAPGLLGNIPSLASADQDARLIPSRGGRWCAGAEASSSLTAEPALACATSIKELVMHDIDRTQMEYTQELPGFEAEQFEYGTFGETEWSGETFGETILSEADEVQLASELLAGQQRGGARPVPRQSHQEVGSDAGRTSSDPRSGRRSAACSKASPRRRCRWPAPRSAATSAVRSAPRSAAAWPRRRAARSASKAEMDRKTASSRARNSSFALPRTRRRRPLPRRRRRSARRRASGRGRRGEDSSPPACSPAAAGQHARGAVSGARAEPAAGCAAAARSSCTACEAAWPSAPTPAWMLAQEARALLTRLDRVKPFALVEPMVPAAKPPARCAVRDRALISSVGRRELRNVRCVASSPGCAARRASQATAAEAQRRFTFLRLKFNAVLTQFDLFNDVITQRSEHETGVWLSGLDVVVGRRADSARRLLRSCRPSICYLDRGAGAAIRRARTRLPGGGENPVAIIRVPRERMVGSGIASSLVHEVGHQAAALLDLVASLRPVLRGLQRGSRRRARGLAALGALDLGDRRRLLVGGSRRRRVDARSDGRRQPAACVRLPARTRTTRIPCRGSASS